MGLDQWVCIIRNRQVNEEVDFECMGYNDEEIFSWRKHPNLQGWMNELYYKKGGEEIPYNCKPLLLTRKDILNLRNDVENDKLPYTNGFFFGQSQPRYKEDDLNFCQIALVEIDTGNQIYYFCSW